MLTPEEFSMGWALLVVQPWGKPYRNLTEHGEPNKVALTQFDFYFRQLRFAALPAWLKMAGEYAKGTKWPALDEIKHALKMANAPFMPKLEAPKADAFIARDEFGLDLFECIKAEAKRRLCVQQIEVALKQDLPGRARVLQGELDELLKDVHFWLDSEQITPNDIRRILGTTL